jgi:lactoylglutathione lyase
VNNEKIKRFKKNIKKGKNDLKIHHIALWTNKLEEMKNFYSKYFDCKSNDKYTNQKKSFESYFLELDGETKIEIMKMPSIPENSNDIEKQYIGLIHFAIAIGNREKVELLTKKLRDDGYKVVSHPRETGDGYYESCILDPDGNRIEIIA